MFNNVGGKIKVIAGWVGVILPMLSFAVGLLFVLIGDDLDILGWLMMLAFPIILCLSSLFIYGFGEMVDTAVYLRGGNDLPVSQPEKPEMNTAQSKPSAPRVIERNQPKASAPTCGDATPVTEKEVAPSPSVKSAPVLDHEAVAVDNGVCPDCNCSLQDATIAGIKECPKCGRMFG